MYNLMHKLQLVQEHSNLLWVGLFLGILAKYCKDTKRLK